jgi:hypothetical protein
MLGPTVQTGGKIFLSCWQVIKSYRTPGLKRGRSSARSHSAGPPGDMDFTSDMHSGGRRNDHGGCASDVRYISTAKDVLGIYLGMNDESW